MAGKHKDWTREEHILAFNVYCKISRQVTDDTDGKRRQRRRREIFAASGSNPSQAPSGAKYQMPLLTELKISGVFATNMTRRRRCCGGRAQAPRNGLCLNALHDRAFDRHLMWIEDGYVIRFSPKLTSTLNDLPGRSDAKTGQPSTINWLTSFDGVRLLLPKQFAPDTEFLKRHAEKCERALISSSM